MTLRPLADADLELLFAWEQDPLAIRMAAFTHEDPTDRDAFDEHYARVLADPDNRVLAVVDDAGGLVGSVSSFTMMGDREVSYWIDPSRWGEGLATAALRALLDVEPTRPLHGRVAEHNHGSAQVLERAGFVRVGTDSGYAAGVGREVVELLYRLDA